MTATRKTPREKRIEKYGNEILVILRKVARKLEMLDKRHAKATRRFQKRRKRGWRGVELEPRVV